MDACFRPHKRARVMTHDNENGAPRAATRNCFDVLPDELLAIVLHFIPRRERELRCTLVCKRWQNAIDAGRLFVSIAPLQRRKDVVFDLSAVALRFPRIRTLRIVNPLPRGFIKSSAMNVIRVNSSLDSSSSSSSGSDDSDSDSDSDLVNGGDDGDDASDHFEPVVAVDGHHPMRWCDTLDPGCVRWHSTLTTLSLENLLLGLNVVWLRELVALAHVSLVKVAHCSLKVLLATSFMGSAATLQSLTVGALLPSEEDIKRGDNDLWATLNLLFTSYPELSTLKLHHLRFRNVGTISAAPFPEHTELTRLQIHQVQSSDPFPLHCFRTPNLIHLTLGNVSVPPAPPVGFPRLALLQLQSDVRGFDTIESISAWAPHVRHLELLSKRLPMIRLFAAYSAASQRSLPSLLDMAYYFTRRTHIDDFSEFLLGSNDPIVVFFNGRPFNILSWFNNANYHSPETKPDAFIGLI